MNGDKLDPTVVLVIAFAVYLLGSWGYVLAWERYLRRNRTGPSDTRSNLRGHPPGD